MTKPHIVLVTNLFPNALEPTRGIYTQHILLALQAYYRVSVIAPVAWRPSWLKALPPLQETWQGAQVYHPRYVVIPKMLRSSYALTFAIAVRALLKRLVREQQVQLINVHWAYPDGAGTYLAAKDLGVPVVVHTLGCDLNEFTNYWGRRQWIRYLLKRADHVVHVSKPLREVALRLGSAVQKNSVVLNGIDQHQFQPRAKAPVREKLGLLPQAPYVLFVGNFNIEKGLIYLIEAWQKVHQRHPHAHLLVAGSGPEAAQIQQRMDALDVNASITLLGRLAHAEVNDYLNAADILCLPSLREGCPNIILEAAASCLPVVASRVGAVPEIIGHDRGILVPSADSKALSTALDQALCRDWQLPPFQWISWQDNAAQLQHIFTPLMAKDRLTNEV
jgi:glycosyltransferase involved in cell wall biosynthesis